MGNNPLKQAAKGGQLQNCQRCQRLFRVLLTEGYRGWQRAYCPYCQAAHYFDTSSAPTGAARPARSLPELRSKDSYHPPPVTPPAQASQTSPSLQSSGQFRSQQSSQSPSQSLLGEQRNGELRQKRSLFADAPDSTFDSPKLDSHREEDQPLQQRSPLQRINREQAKADERIADDRIAENAGPWRQRQARSAPTRSFSRSSASHLPSASHLSGIAAKLAKWAMGKRLSRWRLLRAKNIIRALFAIWAAGSLAILAAIFTLDWQELYLLKEPEAYLKRLNSIEPNRIVDRDGELLAELFSQKTGNLKPQEAPKSLKEKLIFIEDQRFYEHKGIHWPSILRAAFRNIGSLRYSQGGSTITQQLARILLVDRQKTILRKLREASLALYLEKKLTKEQIITIYMNLVYLGHGAIGFQNAARFYFDKEIDDLGFFEELALASLPSGPERFSPLRHPRRLQGKMELIYQRMQRAAPDLLPDQVRQKEYRREIATFLRNLNKSPETSVFGLRANYAPYVAEHVRLKLAELLGRELQYGAGLQIKTSISRHLQEASARETKRFINENAPYFPPVRLQEGKPIEKKVEEELNDAYSSISLAAALFGPPATPKEQPRLQAAAVGIENNSGNIVFLQGGADFNPGNQLNRVTQMYRQTGSAIKPIVYSAAIEEGAITAATLLDDRPIFEARKPEEGQESYWAPGNFDEVFEGFIPVRDAFARSKNIPAIRVARAVGLKRLGNQFARFFFPQPEAFQKRFRMDESIAIGSLEMSPLEMAVAYSAFASNGVIHRPQMILSIESRSGEQIYSAKGQDEFKLNIPKNRRALPADVAEIMISLLRDSARYGGVRRGNYQGRRFFGKTGTSNAYRDAWFIGGTPELTTAVWVGYDSNSYSMNHGTGARLAGALWGQIMRNLPESGNSFLFSERALRVEICSETGQRLGEQKLERNGASCLGEVRQELFRPQFPPDEPIRQPQRARHLADENLPGNWLVVEGNEQDGQESEAAQDSRGGAMEYPREGAAGEPTENPGKRSAERSWEANRKLDFN